MGLRFAVRGTQLDAWYAPNGKTSAGFSNLAPSDYPAVATNTNTGVFSQRVINTVPSSVQKSLVYPGRTNVCAATNNGAFTMIARLVPTVTQATCTGWAFATQCSFGLHGFGLRAGIKNTGVAYVQIGDAAGNVTTINGTTVYSVTINVPFDFCISWDGTTTANAIKVSVDGVQTDTMTSTQACTSRDVNLMSDLILGTVTSGPTTSKLNLNEFLLWDTAENHVYTARTAFWNVDAYDGLAIDKVEVMRELRFIKAQVA